MMKKLIILKNSIKKKYYIKRINKLLIRFTFLTVNINNNIDNLYNYHNNKNIKNIYNNNKWLNFNLEFYKNRMLCIV
jgi:hypothetical protein